MPLSRYLKLKIGDNEVQVTNPEDLPLSIDYALEDPGNFQEKPSSQALSLQVPATLQNDQGANTFRHPDVMDLTAGKIFRGNLPFSVIESSMEIMTGKAFLKAGTHNDKPLSYKYDLFGDNADWKIDLEEVTLYDLLKHIQFIFTKAAIVDSWAYDGISEDLPYVFAPVKYRGPMGGTVDNGGAPTPVDDDMAPIYMKPSVAKFWLFHWAFKRVGYKVRSTFINSPFFRRQMMPWTWGNFLDSDGTRLDAHRFRAKSGFPGFWYHIFTGGSVAMYPDLHVNNDSTDGCFDANATNIPGGDYSYNASTFEMTFTYNPPHYGTLQAFFSMLIKIDAATAGNSEIALYVQWKVNGVQQDGGWGTYTVVDGNKVFGISSGSLGGTATYHDITPMFATLVINPGDVVTAKMFLYANVGNFGGQGAAATLSVEEFKLDNFKIPIGGTIDFANYTGLKKWKFLDFFRGVIDEFNMSVKTDPINKIVTIEPTHQWSSSDDLTKTTPGYFVNDFVPWEDKKDLSKEWEMENFADYDRELIFKYKDDPSDGILKKVQDRFICTLASGKYIFPDRFKAGKKEITNRFFSPTMHYEVDQWRDLGTGANDGISPQMICIIPENISNTSNSESANTFEPKSVYYKGLQTNVGAWKFDGEVKQDFPYMFAVNYKEGGENDPILSYSDEKIKASSGFIVGKGLLKRFYWQRLAIMRNGQWYNTWFHLKNVDVVNQLHQEYKSFNGHRWELIQIKGYRPLQEVSTACLLRRWAAISQEDLASTFPSESNVLNNSVTSPLDIKYAQLKCLINDIPTT